MRDAFEFVEAVRASPKISKESADRLEGVQFYEGYAERGYSDPESKLICVGNWNDADRRNPNHNKDAPYSPETSYWIKADDYVSRVAKVLEKRYGAELEWSDEWSNCYECNKLVRTQPDCYSWQPSYAILSDCDFLCHECLVGHADELLEEYIGRSSKALSRDLGVDPGDHGFACILKGMENGFHEHMAADPKVIAAELRKRDVDRFLFVIDQTSQFYITFSCWVPEEDVEKLDFEDCDKCDGAGVHTSAVGGDRTCYACDGLCQFPNFKTDAAVSPAELLKRALMGASASVEAAGPAPHDGDIRMTKIDGDQVSTKWVSPEDFIAGKALDK